MLNIVLVLFLGFMIYWWGSQGIFSAMLQLALTVIAGVVALAFWEPITQMFISVVPDSAWAIGLLLPFGAALIVLRVVFDMLVPGNLDYHNMAHKTVGGFLGFVSGVLIAGMLIIGIQYSGMSSLLNYEGFTLDGQGKPVRKSSLVVPVDTIAGGFYSYLSGGAFSPIVANTTVADYHPMLAVESSFYHQAAFPASRRGLRPENVKLAENAGCFQYKGALPQKLDKQLTADASRQVVIVGTDVVLQATGRHGAADADASFRIRRTQVSLIYTEGDGAPAERAFPVGYIQSGEYRAFRLAEDWAYSAPSVANVVHHWVFKLSPKASPRFLCIKGTRLDLPAQPISDMAAGDKLISAAVAVASGNNGGSVIGPGEGVPTAASGEFITISDRLPFTINRNVLNAQSVTTNKEAILSGAATVRRERGTPGPGLSVTSIHHADSARIVQVDLGSPKEKKSLLGRIFAMVTANTQAPVLSDARGQTYFAIGYGIVSRGSYTFSINPNQTIRALSQIDKLGSASGDDHVVLYYQLPAGVSLVKFQLGAAQTQTIDPPLKVE